MAPARRDRQVGWGQGIGQADVGLCAADARPQAFHQRCLGLVACDEVERVHGPALAKTVDASGPLLEARRIPRQLEVDDASTAVMEVQALTACVGGKQQGRSSCRKPIDRGLALGSTEPTVKEHGIAPERSLHMEERVAVFGEDDGRLASALETPEQPAERRKLRFTSDCGGRRIEQCRQQPPFTCGVAQHGPVERRRHVTRVELAAAIVERQPQLIESACRVKRDVAKCLVDGVEPPRDGPTKRFRTGQRAFLEHGEDQRAVAAN